jgi:hypothetical protein
MRNQQQQKSRPDCDCRNQKPSPPLSNSTHRRLSPDMQYTTTENSQATAMRSCPVALRAKKRSPRCMCRGPNRSDIKQVHALYSRIPAGFSSVSSALTGR